MDWLFIPLGNAIKWSFQFIEAAGMNFNWLMILVGAGLMVYWVSRMVKDGMANDKGVYRPEQDH